MKSFLQGKKTLPAPALQAPAHKSVLAANGASASGGVSHPNIEVVKEGEKIVRLVITCACGERMDIECLYRPGA
jgi:hypothetical protein